MTICPYRTVPRPRGVCVVFLQNFTLNDTVWLLYTNENSTITYSGNCTTDSGIAGLYESDTTVCNLLNPFESYTLEASDRPFYFDGKASYFGCIESITLQPFTAGLSFPLTAGSHPPQPSPNLPPDMIPESMWTPIVRTLTASTSRLNFRI